MTESEILGMVLCKLLEYHEITKRHRREILEARIEEHEQLKYSSCPHIDSAERLIKLKKERENERIGEPTKND